MFTIGDFARLGRVSVRMLRHYDALGLLRPARVDQATGYRYYDAGQLSRLNRLIALKDLGLGLDQVGQILDDQVEPAELGGMLRLRRAELADHLAEETARLATTGPAVAYYEQVPEGVRIHAGAPVNADRSERHDFDIVDLPPIEQAATVIHHGPMDHVDVVFQGLARWIEENGYRSTGLAREVYLRYGEGERFIRVPALSHSMETRKELF